VMTYRFIMMGLIVLSKMLALGRYEYSETMFGL